jgi:hypothetical protein
MSSDLLFSILPREGKVPMSHNEHKVQKVSKESKLKHLTDEDEELHHEELEVRKRYQAKKQPKDRKGQNKQEKQARSENEGQIEQDAQDKEGPTHLDIYV